MFARLRRTLSHATDEVVWYLADYSGEVAGVALVVTVLSGVVFAVVWCVNHY